MKKHTFIASLLLYSVTAGCLVSCSNDDPAIPEPAPNPIPEEESKTVHVTLTLTRRDIYEKQAQSSAVSKGTRAETEITYGKSVIYYVVVGEKISVYAKGTKDKLGTLECIDATKMIFKGDLTAKNFTDNEEFYIALDDGEAQNIQWDGSTFTFVNAYSKGNYKGEVAYNGSRIVWDVPTGKGTQCFYELGKGKLDLSDNSMTGYIDALTPIAVTTFDKGTVTYVKQQVKDKGFTVLKLKVQTDEHSLNTWTFNPENYSVTEDRSDRTTREILYDATNIQWTKDPIMLVYTLNPGMWTNPVITLYGGTDSNNEAEKLATAKVDDMYKKIEFIPLDKYNAGGAASYQRPFNRIIPYGTLVKE